MLSFQSLLSSLEFLVVAQSWVGPAGCVSLPLGLVLVCCWCLTGGTGAHGTAVPRWWDCAQQGWGLTAEIPVASSSSNSGLRGAQNLGRCACRPALSLGFVNNSPCGSSHVSQGMVAFKSPPEPLV